MEIVTLIEFIVHHLPAFIAAFFVILVCFIIYCGSRGEARQRTQNYLEASDKLFTAVDSKSIKKVRESISCLDYEYNKVKDITGSSGNYLYSEDRGFLVEHLHDLEQDKWEKKANKYLQEFSDCYLSIVSHELEHFESVELLYKTKKRCIEQWQKYFAIDLSEYETTIYPKRYLRDWMGDDYDPCMESHATLEKKLNECVAVMRPEYKRKTALLDIIVNYVATKNTISRSDLLKKTFKGYSQDEVKYCYRELIKTNRLFEMKIGGRYFVSLSDKEAAKPNKKNEEAQEIIIENDTTVKDKLIRYLKSNNAEFIDKTDKGGGLYFFDEKVSNELKDKGYKVKYAQNGTKSTAGRPAWYIALK